MNSTPPQSAQPSVEESNPVATEGDKLQQELAEQKDRHLRLAADFDNYRKRTVQETERRAAAQKEGLIHELLPVIDNLERALATNESASFEQLHQGVEMILHQLRQVLKQHHIKPEGSLGHAFNPLHHEAVASRHDPTQPDHVVLETIQPGYSRGKDVFRPAKVIVNDLGKKEITSHAG
jgi:molecular chaperone GrpE